MSTMTRSAAPFRPAPPGEGVTTRYASIDTPIGPMLLAGSVDGGRTTITHLHFASHRAGPFPEQAWSSADPALADAVAQVEEYLAGERTVFDLELSPAGTAFQLAVWAGLRTIPFGATLSYGELATRIGRPGAARAIGHANARNPIGLIVPCHRVIGSDGTLTGFAGGIERKAWLLEHERAVLASGRG